MFTLAISCLTTSNLPWFMDLTFQVSMQYCSLQRQILLSSPDTSTTEASFPLWPIYFILPGAISSSPPLFPSSILDTFWLGGLIFQCHIILPFYTVHGVLTVSILEWFTIHSSSGPRFCQNSPLWPWVSPHSTAHGFTELCKSLHQGAVTHEGAHWSTCRYTLWIWDGYHHVPQCSRAMTCEAICQFPQPFCTRVRVVDP